MAGKIYRQIRAHAEMLFPWIFTGMFVLSGIYEIPFVPLDVGLITWIKKILFVLFMALMASALRWPQAVNRQFTWWCGLWIVVHILHWSFRQEFEAIYLHRLVQITYIWLFVSLVMQQKSATGNFLAVDRWFRPAIVSVICLFLVIFSTYPQISMAISNGLGNNRVNFSIWLSQLVFLMFLVSGSGRENIRHALLLSSPVLVLQVFSGGRSGLLVSLGLCLYFAFRAGNVRLLVTGAIYLMLLVWLSASFSPLPEQYPGTAIFRMPGSANFSTFDPAFGGGVLAWMDRVSSYRIGIMASALESLDLGTALAGVGVMNFKGAAIGEFWDVHNIYVRALGELGIFGFISLVILLLLPYRRGRSRSRTYYAKAFCAGFLILGMVHPELLTTAISTCMIYWLAYAEILKSQSEEAI